MAKRAVLRGDVNLRSNLRKLAKVYDPGSLDRDIEESLDPLVKQTVINARPLRDYVGKYSSRFPPPSPSPKGGHLDQGVASRRVFAKGLRRTWWVAFARRARKLAHLVEFGTAPHWQPNLKFRHPGARPKPFFRPAFEATKGEVIDRLTRRAARRLSLAAAKLNKR